MSVEFYRESPGKFDSRTLSRETLSRWTGRKENCFSKGRVPVLALKNIISQRSWRLVGARGEADAVSMIIINSNST